MRADDGCDDRQTEAASLAGASRREERLERLLLDFGRHARPVVGHADRNLSVSAAHLDAHGASCADRPDRIVGQVHQHLLELSRPRGHGRDGRELRLEPNAGCHPRLEQRRDQQ